MRIVSEDWKKSVEVSSVTLEIVHSDGHTTVNKTSKVTGKGQSYFVNIFLKEVA